MKLDDPVFAAHTCIRFVCVCAQIGIYALKFEVWFNYLHHSDRHIQGKTGRRGFQVVKGTEAGKPLGAGKMLSARVSPGFCLYPHGFCSSSCRAAGSSWAVVTTCI